RGLRLADALFWYWDVQGLWREGADWLERALLAASAAEAADRARGMFAAGHLVFHVGDYDRARTLLDESIGLLRSLGKRRDLAEALLFLGVLMRRQSQFKEAALVQEESFTLFNETRDTWGGIFAQNELTRLARLTGNVERARELAQRTLTVARETQEQREIA